MSTTLIGDVHGKFDAYKRILKGCRNSIQLGDMGVGFFAPYTDEPKPNPPHRLMKQGGHRFIRGNHDNPAACRRHSQWIADGTIEGEVMFVGGALSIDRAWRTETFDWWPDEELSTAELTALVDRFVVARPRIMLTHECPEYVADWMMAAFNRVKFNDPSRTRQAFQVMFEAWQPDLWVFGHYHVSLDQVIEGTRFVCLAELEARAFDF